MELWTDYEGRTIDNAYPLARLLESQGRSAFFSTSNGTGVSRVIRLVEPHFDEDEILARWRGVAVLNHPNILKLEKFGQATLDGASLVYAVMEPFDADLGEVVSGQRLTVPEARQLATSLVAVLQTLHTHGFVHEHIEAANVRAVGEIVKLRSDCIREAPEGEDGRRLKKRDVHDLTVVLLQALTQQRTLEAAARDLPLPAPFDQIVRKGMSGEWDLAEIAAALEEPALPRNASPAAVVPEAVARPSSSPAVRASSGPKTADVSPTARSLRVAAGISTDDEMPGAGRNSRPGSKLMVAVGLGVLVALWLGWHLVSGRHASQIAAPQKISAPAPVVDSGAMKPAAAHVPVATGNASTPQSNHLAGGRGQWRVIAYTYNREDQAQKKSATVAQRHPELRPEVFTPTGHAPYLVAIGGAMGRDEAFALARKVRGEGLPGDTYAQNYK
jgi:eukaryotic-like serine/threonine-protein kinase